MRQSARKIERRSQPRGRQSRTTNTRKAHWLRPVGRLAAKCGLGLVILAVFVFGVFPTGRFVDQREQLDKAELELAGLLEENADLQARVDRLESDAEIERVARDEFDLVYPGEEVYAVLPPAGG